MFKILKPLLLLIAFTAIYSCSYQQEKNDASQNLIIDTTINSNIELNDSLFEVTDDTIKPEPTEKIKSLTDLYKRTQKKASIFVIKANRDTVIKCKEGTLLSIPANCFARAKDGKAVIGDVKLSVKEFYKISDMLLANLTTSSNGNMIETGGMLNIKANAKDNNDSLTLNKGKNITLALPKTQNDNNNGMQLFNGTHDSLDNLNWKPRIGLAGSAQRWKAGNFSNYTFSEFNAGKFVFPDETPKKTPTLKSKPSKEFSIDIIIPIRDVLQNGNSFTKTAFAYIDTLGEMHVFKIGAYSQNLLFNTNFNSTFYKSINVNVPVFFNVSIKTDINISYHQKLLKMKKGNADSLITATVTFIPFIKRANYETIKGKFKNAITVSEYKLLLNDFYKRKNEYDKRINLLVNNPVANISTAQDYLLLSTQQLGWINCDRFYSYPEKVDYLVKSDEKIKLLIVFNNLKSILSNHSNGLFYNMPQGEKITIVALKTENEKLMLAMQETTITKEPFEKLEFKPVTVNEYKAKLNQLNSL